MSTNSVGNWGFILPPPVPSAKNRSLNNYQYILYHRPDFTRTTKKRESAIGSIEYTIKKGIATVKSGIKKADFRFKADENQVWYKKKK